MPLHLILASHAFAKYGIDFVGPIKPLGKSTHVEYIIVAINYLTKWAEAKATPSKPRMNLLIFCSLVIRGACLETLTNS